ncbi:MAG: hypothetical protein V4524_03075 [Patescibacteria group bacterium]
MSTSNPSDPKMGQVTKLTFNRKNGNFSYKIPGTGARNGIQFYITPTGNIKDAVLSMGISGDLIKIAAKNGSLTHNLSDFGLVSEKTVVRAGDYYLVPITVAHSTSGQSPSDPFSKPVTLSQTLVNALDVVWIKNKINVLELNINKLKKDVNGIPTDAHIKDLAKIEAATAFSGYQAELNELRELLDKKQPKVIVKRTVALNLGMILMKALSKWTEARKKKAQAKAAATPSSPAKPALSPHRAQKHANYRLRWALAGIAFLILCLSALGYYLNQKSGHQGVTPLASALVNTNAGASSNAPASSVATIVTTNSLGTNANSAVLTAAATNSASVIQQMVVGPNCSNVSGPVNMNFSLLSVPPQPIVVKTIVKTTVIVTNPVAVKKPFTPAVGYQPPVAQKTFVPAQAVTPPQASVIIINNQTVNRGGYGPGTVLISGWQYDNQLRGGRQVCYRDNYRAIRSFPPPCRHQ